LETTEYEKPMFNVDAAYILHLEGNGRLASVKAQLEAHHVAAVVHILHNKGYKKVKKDLPSQAPAHDIVDAYKYIFRDAQTREYGNILVLEDDFFFRDDVQPADVAAVNKFVAKNEKRRMVYHLGCIPAFMMPVDTKGNYLATCSGTHASVYTEKFRKYTLQYKKVIEDWDWFVTFASLRYAYTKPLAYQLYPETDNSKNWMELFGFTRLVKIWIRVLKLDVQPEPGYSICYFVAKSVFYLGLIFAVALGVALYNYETTLRLLRGLFESFKKHVVQPLSESIVSFRNK
jgi:hypothetical protein